MTTFRSGALRPVCGGVLSLGLMLVSTQLASAQVPPNMRGSTSGRGLQQIGTPLNNTIFNQGPIPGTWSPPGQLGAYNYYNQYLLGSPYGAYGSPYGGGYGATTANLRGGLGSASAVTRQGYQVGAIAVVNAISDHVA